MQQRFPNVSKIEFRRIYVVALMISIIDGLQSYYYQQVAINPFQEANALPFSFYQYGFIGYLFYIPVESVFTFALLFCCYFGAKLIIADKINNQVPSM